MINSGEKGKRGEREVVHIINRILGTNFRRTPNSGGLSFKGDIIDINVDNPLYDYHVEIKNTKYLEIPAWMKQVRRDMPLGKRPLLIPKHKAVFYAWVELRDFLSLVREIIDLKEELVNLKGELDDKNNKKK